MFWKKKATPGDDPDAGSESGSARDVDTAHDRAAAQYADAALDTVGGILRALGRYAFDITGVDAQAFRRQCESWAEHLAIGGPHPDTATGSSASSDSPRPADRDWVGARHFVLKRRQDESDYMRGASGICAR